MRAGAAPDVAVDRAALVHTFAGARDLLAPAAANPLRYPGLLESAARGANGRYDILFAFPREALVLGRDGRVRDALGNDRGPRFLDALDAAWRARRDSAAGEIGGTDRGASHASLSPHAAASPPPLRAGDLPFRGGWLLFLGYELAAEIEPVLALPAAADPGIPVAFALRCPAAAIADRELGCTHVVAEAGEVCAFESIIRDIDAIAPFAAPDCAVRELDEDDPQRFLQGVAAVQEHLRAGDAFQVNLSREWRARLAGDPAPAAVFASLRRANPAPFAGLLQWRDFAIASSSPERLVSVRAGTATTRPIAGTRPRLPGDDDAARRRELIGHAKERAEHVMLIDLERNDLGRVCVPGSVVVDELMTIESYADVHHIVSGVRGTLRTGSTPGEVIRALFPGGTITGCPKVRTMQIIAALEGVGRGAYTGALGYLDRSGDLDLNILIRTLAMCGDRVCFRAGAGIVADSVPDRELEETRAKARGLLRALGRDG